VSRAGSWRLAWTLGLSLLVIAGPSTSAAPRLKGPRFVEQTLPRAGGQPGSIRVTLAVPAGYDDTAPVPVVVSLHFGGPVTPFVGGAMLRVLVEPALRELGALMVAPDCTGRGWTDGESEADVLAVLDWVGANYRVDARRSLIVGYSMGGRGVWHLAARHVDRFAAAVVISGPTPETLADAEWRVPTTVIHSLADDVVPFEQTAGVVRSLQAGGAPVEFVVVRDVTHYQTVRFTEPLRQTARWVLKVWGEKRARDLAGVGTPH